MNVRQKRSLIDSKLFAKISMSSLPGVVIDRLSKPSEQAEHRLISGLEN